MLRFRASLNIVLLCCPFLLLLLCMWLPFFMPSLPPYRLCVRCGRCHSWLKLRGRCFETQHASLWCTPHRIDGRHSETCTRAASGGGGGGVVVAASVFSFFVHLSPIHASYHLPTSLTHANTSQVYCGSEEGKLLAEADASERRHPPARYYIVQSVDRARQLFTELAPIKYPVGDSFRYAR